VRGEWSRTLQTNAGDFPEFPAVANKGKLRNCPKCGERYSRQRLRCPSCGEANDLLKEEPRRGGLLDRIPVLEDLPDSTRILIGIFATLVAVAVGVVVYFLLSRG
jgi:hypothetical protein